MPQIDLGPDDYRKRDPRTGRWQIPDDPKLARNYFFVIVAVLAFIFWNRTAVSSASLFGVTALFSWGAGIMFALWLKDRY